MNLTFFLILAILFKLPLKNLILFFSKILQSLSSLLLFDVAIIKFFLFFSLFAHKTVNGVLHKEIKDLPGNLLDVVLDCNIILYFKSLSYY